MFGVAVAALAIGRSPEDVPASTSVDVRPAEATVGVGQAVQLTAVLRDDEGRALPDQRFEWWSPDPGIAKVDSKGVVTGVARGTVTVAAITPDRSQSGFSDVTVTDQDQPPPESSGASRGGSDRGADPAADDSAPGLPQPLQSDRSGGPGPNEPPGLSFIVDRPFETYDENGWTDRHHGGAQTVADGVERATYRRGFVGGGAPAESWVRLNYDEGGQQTVYLAFEYLLSANWQGHPSHMNKIWYFSGDGHTFATVKAYGGPGANEFPIQVTTKQTTNSVSGRKGRNINANRGGPKLRRGQRALVEMVVKLNSSANAYDGELHVWIDGVRTHEFTPARGNGIRWWDASPKAARTINGLKWAPVWGGTKSTVSETMYAELSRVYVSGR